MSLLTFDGQCSVLLLVLICFESEKDLMIISSWYRNNLLSTAQTNGCWSCFEAEVQMLQVSSQYNSTMYRVSQKEIIFKLILEFLSLGGVFLGVKIILRTLGTKNAKQPYIFLFPKFLELFFRCGSISSIGGWVSVGHESICKI